MAGRGSEGKGGGVRSRKGLGTSGRDGQGGRDIEY